MSSMRCGTGCIPHQVEVADLLAAARLIESYPSAVTLLGLVPEAIELAVARCRCRRRRTEGACRGRCRRGAKSWLRDGSRAGELNAGIALFTISLVISACEGGAARSESCRAAGVARGAQQAGRLIFVANCAICHGVGGNGSGLRREGINPLPANLTLPPWSKLLQCGTDIPRYPKRRARDGDARVADA